MRTSGESDEERRALLLFEQLADLAEGSDERRALIDAVSPKTRLILEELEQASLRAPSRFATAFPIGDAGDATRPTQVGPYRLEAVLGAGGMGEVWRAERSDGLFEQTVAIKLIRPGIMSALAADRFTQERRLLARLSHPGIARILDGGVAEGWPYLVMDYIEGAPIDAWADDQAASVASRVDKVAQASAAVQAAHAQLIAHADIKPENLLVTREGQVKLIDFGIAELIEAEGAAPIRPMTRHFSSPERIAGGGPSVPDDIYALGMVLAAVVPPADRDRDLDAIIAKARSPNAPDRYGSAEQLSRDLTRWQAQRPVAARPPRFGYRARLFLRRNRRAVLLAIALIFLSALVAGIAIRDRRAARAAEVQEAQRAHDLLAVNRYLLFDLDPRLSKLDHSLLLRAALAERAQAYIDRLGALPDASPAVRVEAAQGLQRLAWIQDRPGKASLGQPQAALTDLGRAAALLDGLSGSDVARTFVQIRIDEARIRLFAINDLAGAERAITAAGARLRKLGAAGRPLAGDFLLLQAQLASWQDRSNDEARLAAMALRAPLPADPREAALFRINAFGLQGEGQFYAASSDPSGPALRQSLQPYLAEWRIARDAEARWPGDPAFLRAQAHAAWDLGSDLLELGQAQKALAVLDQGIASITTLTSREPEDDEAARLRNIIEDNRAQTLGKLGRGQEAMALYDVGVARWAAMWRHAPNPVRLRDYAIALNTDGTVHAEAGDRAQACRVYAQAHALFEGLRLQRRIVPFDQQETLRSIEENQAKYCARNPAG